MTTELCPYTFKVSHSKLLFKQFVCTNLIKYEAEIYDMNTSWKSLTVHVFFLFIRNDFP